MWNGGDDVVVRCMMKMWQESGRMGWGGVSVNESTLASPQLRINLSPFTKDFRVEVQYNESIDTFLKCLGSPEALILLRKKEKGREK